MQNLIKETNKKTTVTVVCFFTREWAVDRWLENFDKLNINRGLTELVWWIDVVNPELYRKLFDYLMRTQNDWGGIKLIQSDQYQANEVRQFARRDRIALIHNQIKEYIGDTKWVFGLEDDTVFDTECFKNLFIDFMAQDNAGYITGVQVGRWNIKMIGGWRADNINKPTKMSTVEYQEKGIEEIDGGGLFCYLTTTALFKGIEYKWEAEPLSVDVCFGLAVKRMGFGCYIDYGVVTGHNTEAGVLYPNENVVVAEFNLVDNEWQMKSIVSVKE
jgi:hypothetical protein